MEATTLKSKKQFNKGILKKTFKNVICRPDPIFWPQTSVEEAKTLEEKLNKYKVEIPEFKKPLWSEVCQIPKKLRPKPPPIPKVEGLIFGITKCQKAIESKECLGVLIEAAVNPKTIVQMLIDMCTVRSVPVLCLKELRRISKINYGISTSALGVKQNHLPELEQALLEISKCHRPPKLELKTINVNNDLYKEEEPMDATNGNGKMECPYLYRTDNKTRVFTPLTQQSLKLTNKFTGQDYIELSSLPKERMDRKQYMKMIVKKISSNPNRRKVMKT